MDAAKQAAKAKANEAIEKGKQAAGLAPRDWNEVRQ